MFHQAIPPKLSKSQSTSGLQTTTTPESKNQPRLNDLNEVKTSRKDTKAKSTSTYHYVMPPLSSKDEKKHSLAKLNADFKLGNYATDLVEFTLEMCKKPKEGESPRFPAAFYDSYVSELIRSAINIHRNICNANAVRYDPARRGVKQEVAIGEAVNLEHLILIAYHRGWISEKQHDRWQTMICDLHYGLIKWMS